MNLSILKGMKIGCQLKYAGRPHGMPYMTFGVVYIRSGAVGKDLPDRPAFLGISLSGTGGMRIDNINVPGLKSGPIHGQLHALFLAAAVTDVYDGILARRYEQETDFGRFMDPLADKMTTLVAFVYFVEIPEISWPAWLVVLLLGRELAVNSLRTLGASREEVLSAATSGKYKTAVQMAGIGLVLLGLIFFRLEVVGREWLNGVSWTTMFLVLVLTIYSGFEYYYQNWPMLWLSSVHSS